MVIYLKHEIHGTKVACSDLEAAADIASGWVVYAPDGPAEPEPEPAVPVEESAEGEGTGPADTDPAEVSGD